MRSVPTCLMGSGVLVVLELSLLLSVTWYMNACILGFKACLSGEHVAVSTRPDEVFMPASGSAVCAGLRAWETDGMCPPIGLGGPSSNASQAFLQLTAQLMACGASLGCVSEARGALAAESWAGPRLCQAGARIRPASLAVKIGHALHLASPWTSWSNGDCGSVVRMMAMLLLGLLSAISPSVRAFHAPIDRCMQLLGIATNLATLRAGRSTPPHLLWGAPYFYSLPKRRAGMMYVAFASATVKRVPLRAQVVLGLLDWAVLNAVVSATDTAMYGVSHVGPVHLLLSLLGVAVIPALVAAALEAMGMPAPPAEAYSSAAVAVQQGVTGSWSTSSVALEDGLSRHSSTKTPSTVRTSSLGLQDPLEMLSSSLVPTPRTSHEVPADSFHPNPQAPQATPAATPNPNTITNPAPGAPDSFCRRSMPAVVDGLSPVIMSVSTPQPTPLASHQSSGSGSTTATGWAVQGLPLHALGLPPPNPHLCQMGPRPTVTALSCSASEPRVRRAHAPSMQRSMFATGSGGGSVGAAVVNVPPAGPMDEPPVSLSYKPKTHVTLMSVKVRHHPGSYSSYAPQLLAASTQRQGTLHARMTAALDSGYGWLRSSVCVPGCVQLFALSQGVAGSTGSTGSGSTDNSVAAPLEPATQGQDEILACLPDHAAVAGVQLQMLRSQQRQDAPAGQAPLVAVELLHAHPPSLSVSTPSGTSRRSASNKAAAEQVLHLVVHASTCDGTATPCVRVLVLRQSDAAVLSDSEHPVTAGGRSCISVSVPAHSLQHLGAVHVLLAAPATPHAAFEQGLGAEGAVLGSGSHPEAFEGQPLVYALAALPVLPAKVASKTTRGLDRLAAQIEATEGGDTWEARTEVWGQAWGPLAQDLTWLLGHLPSQMAAGPSNTIAAANEAGITAVSCAMAAAPGTVAAEVQQQVFASVMSAASNMGLDALHKILVDLQPECPPQPPPNAEAACSISAPLPDLATSSTGHLPPGIKLVQSQSLPIPPYHSSHDFILTPTATTSPLTAPGSMHSLGSKALTICSDVYGSPLSGSGEQELASRPASAPQALDAATAAALADGAGCSIDAGSMGTAAGLQLPDDQITAAVPSTRALKLPGPAQYPAGPTTTAFSAAAAAAVATGKGQLHVDHDHSLLQLLHAALFGFPDARVEAAAVAHIANDGAKCDGCVALVMEVLLAASIAHVMGLDSYLMARRLLTAMIFDAAALGLALVTRHAFDLPRAPALRAARARCALLLASGVRAAFVVIGPMLLGASLRGSVPLSTTQMLVSACIECIVVPPVLQVPFQHVWPALCVRAATHCWVLGGAHCVAVAVYCSAVLILALLSALAVDIALRTSFLRAYRRMC